MRLSGEIFALVEGAVDVVGTLHCIVLARFKGFFAVTPSGEVVGRRIREPI